MDATGFTPTNRSTLDAPPYSVANGKDFFDWNAFLAQKYIPEEQWKVAEQLARDWVTCACGNQCAVLPRNEYGCPDDGDLVRLGMRFTRVIVGRQKNDAKQVLAQIEARTAYLLSQPGRS